MMTGDSERTASAIAKRVGVDEYYSEVLPEDKAGFVEREKAAGRKVIMVGDGINDSPALSAADVGIAIDVYKRQVLMGPNGAGKSTLGYVLTGNPKYSVTEGKILFKGNDITEEAADKRAKAGMFLSFQEPLEVPGLSLESFIRSALSEQGRNKMRVWNFRKELKAAMEVLHMDPSYAGRDLNVGFSGGEKKKSEILQLMMLKPDLAILDETDSGLDVDAVRLASEGIREYQKENPDGALLIITHSTRILDALHVDATHIMVNGHIVASGDASLVDKINREGYEEYEKLAKKGEDER